MGEDGFGQRSCSEHIHIDFGPDGAGDGRFCRIASCEWVLDGGAWQFRGYDENDLHRFMNGRLIGVHKVLCSAAETVRKGRQDFYLGHDGGILIQIWSRNENSFREIGSWYGKNELIPGYLENKIFNFDLN